MKLNTSLHMEPVTIPVLSVQLKGDLLVPANACGLVLFAHASSIGRRSPKNQRIASDMHDQRLATLALDLMTRDEQVVDDVTRHLRFDIPFLGRRLLAATDWILSRADLTGLPVGYFAAHGAAAAALAAAAVRPEVIRAIVSRSGRPDLAMKVLPRVKAPTLLVVGGEDTELIAANELAYHKLPQPRELVLVDRATHLLEAADTLQEVGRIATGWFLKHLPRDEETRQGIDDVC